MVLSSSVPHFLIFGVYAVHVFFKKCLIKLTSVTVTAGLTDVLLTADVGDIQQQGCEGHAAVVLNAVLHSARLGAGTAGLRS